MSLRRWLLRGVAGLAVIVVVAAGAVAGVIWWSLPPSSMNVRIPGLSGPVSVRFDPDGIPWITAKNATDAAAALGFVHARDRMFQMELMRRVASGRLSELVGPETVRLDEAMRILGLRRQAEAEVARLDPATKAMLEAYSRGVNAWISARGRFAGLEFVALGKPERWSPVDSLLWGKTMALYLAGNWRLKIERAEIAQKVPVSVQRALWPDWPQTLAPTASIEALRRLALALPAFPAPFTLPDEASNEWAVDGAHSATGAPLLAGDPHLAFASPALWYLARIETPEGVLAGATAPGVPFLVLGHNSKIAWTFTTTGADTQDVFVETKVDAGHYQGPDGPLPYVTHAERIRVRGRPDVLFTARETRHGPVLSDVDPTPDGAVLAVAMAALQAPDTAAAGLLALNRAGSVAEAGVAATAISAPVQNLLVADHQDIALFTTGRVPVRKSGDGTVPVEGADGAHDWIGFAQGDQLPRFEDPPSGRLVNANERTWGPDFPVFMGASSFGDWRARRIRALLAARAKPDAAWFASMQVDVTSAFAQTVLPAMLATKPADAASQRVLERLRGWDGQMAADRTEPLLFNEWVRRFFRDMLAELKIEGAAVGPAIDLVGEALTPGGQVLCGGDCAPLLAQSLAETAAALPDPAAWGTVHQVVFAHPLLSRLALVGPLAMTRIAQPGDDSTLFRGSPAPPGWQSVHGPEYRGVYDLADLDRSLFALAPGQSGHPFSANVASTLQRWRDGVPIVLGPAPRSESARIDIEP